MDKIREQELIEDYRKVGVSPKAQGIDTWLQKWEKVYDECSTIKLAEVQGTRPLFDFIKAALPVSPGFADVWNVRLIEDADRYRSGS
jgi:hypothetical protein